MTEKVTIFQAGKLDGEYEVVSNTKASEPDWAEKPGEITDDGLQTYVNVGPATPEHVDVSAKMSSAVAACAALKAIKDRSFIGRHPELGKMVNCKFCGRRHREKELKCEQHFVTKNKDGDKVQGELIPPAGLTGLTARQVLGAQYFAKKRIRQHSNRWIKERAKAAKVKLAKKNRRDKIQDCATIGSEENVDKV